MKRKLMMVLACALAAVSLLPASAGAAPAPVLADGVQQAVGADDCNVSVMHGMYGVSYSQFSYQADFVPPVLNACDETGTYVVSLSLTSGNENSNGTKKWAAERCHITSNVNFPDFGDGACSRWDSAPKWIQSNNNDSTIVGTQLHLCGDVVPCDTLDDAANNPRYSIAAPSLAHGAQTTLNNGLCSVSFMHGDFGSLAFSQMKYRPASGACDTANSFVELAAIDALGNVHTQRCPLSGSGSGTGSCASWTDQGNTLDHWYQASFTDHHIVGSTVRLCDDNAQDPCDEFYRTGF